MHSKLITCEKRLFSKNTKPDEHYFWLLTIFPWTDFNWFSGMGSAMFDGITEALQWLSEGMHGEVRQIAYFDVQQTGKQVMGRRSITLLLTRLAPNS